jgi:hypothetical protein
LLKDLWKLFKNVDVIFKVYLSCLRMSKSWLIVEQSCIKVLKNVLRIIEKLLKNYWKIIEKLLKNYWRMFEECICVQINAFRKIETKEMILEHLGASWTYLMIFDDLWASLSIFKNLWGYWMIFEQIDRFLSIF